MSVDLFEHYKDALRRGHLAAAHGRFDEALEAYREAVHLAPDRALPHSSIGQVLLRQNAVPNALHAFDTALMRAPRDEHALRGRADALARLGRRTDAAAALDLLSDIQESAGRLPDARDTTGRALELAEQKARRRRLQDLTRRVRLASGGRAPDDALQDSLRPLEWTGIADAEITAQLEAAAPLPDDVAVAPGAEAQRNADVAAPVARLEPEPDRQAVATAEPQPEPEPDQPPPDPVALTADAEALFDRGDLAGARVRYLDAAVAYENLGLLAAAIDACYVALAFVPDDAEVHLRLVELYLAAGWNGAAADKLALLGRLTDLDTRQRKARGRIVVLAADHFPDDPRLRNLTATR